MIAQGQTDMPAARARSTRGLNKKESICSECVCEAGWASPRPRTGEQQQWRCRSSSGDSEVSVSSHDKSPGRRSEIESEGRLR